MLRKLLIISMTSVGLSLTLAATTNAQGQGMGTGTSGGASVGVGAGPVQGNANANVNARTHVMTRGARAHSNAAITARAQARGPRFTPPGWRHGKKTGWHCRLGTQGCVPPGLR